MENSYMTTTLIFGIVGLLIIISILVELIAGKTRLRGYGVFERKNDPRMYWFSVLLKLMILILIGVLYYWGLSYAGFTH